MRLAVAAMDVFPALCRSGRGELALYSPQGARSRHDSFLPRVELPPVNARAVLDDGRLPFLALRDKMHAYNARLVVALHGLVCRIIRAIGWAKLAESIVVSNPMSMVNLPRSPLPVNVKPREDMGVIMQFLARIRATDLNFDVTIRRFRSGDLSSVTAVPFLRLVRTVFPAKHASQRVIVENGLQEVLLQCGQISHASVPSVNANNMATGTLKRQGMEN